MKHILFVFFAFALTASAQQLLVLGPFGKPVMVLDEGEKWSIPIQIYSDSDRAEYVPDITTAAWIYWHKDYFKLTGKYTVTITTWNKNDNACLKRNNYNDLCKSLRYQQDLLSIDTRNKTITELQEIVMENDARFNPVNVDSFPSNPIHSFNELSKQRLAAINRINAIVESEMRRAK